MDELNFQKALKHAMDAWAVVAGLDPNAASVEVQNWRMKSTVDDLNMCQEEDPTGLTTAMLLYAIYDSWSTHSTLSVKELLTKDDDTIQMIEQFRTLAWTLSNKQIREAVDDFKDTIFRALVHYKAPKETIEWAKDEANLGLIRRDVLRSMKTLRPHQFLQGEAVTEDPPYNEWVIQFPNINSAVDSIASGPPGIFTVMIWDTDNEVFNHFVFVIWNGGTLTVLTDQEMWKHPEQKNMTRCPGRSLSDRWNRHHFPYELLDAQFDEKGKHVHVPQREGLVLYDRKARSMSGVEDCEPDVMVWIIMMFHQMRERYCRQNLQLEHRSYTFDMVQTRVESTSALVKMDGYVPLSLPDLHPDDLTPEGTKDNWENIQTGKNDWIEDRFRHKVRPETVNLVTDDKDQLLLGDNPDPQVARMQEPVESRNTIRVHGDTEPRAVLKRDESDSLRDRGNTGEGQGVVRPL